MKVYAFRALNSENEDFLRDIAILENQTFLDLHQFIIDVCGFRDDELASFYLCDDSWYKQKEISLMDMSIEENDFQRNEDDEDMMSVSTMENVTIGSLGDAIGKKVLYEYDFMSPITLFLECISIEETDDDDYPVCLKSFGDLDEVIETQRARKDEIDFDDMDDNDLFADLSLGDDLDEGDDYGDDDGFDEGFDGYR